MILSHDEAAVRVTELPSGKYRILVERCRPDQFIPRTECETSYPVELIQQILTVKGPAYLCDEIERDESPEYTQRTLKWGVLSYTGEEQFANKRVLDFGCGSGASTVILARMFPDAEIVGVELEESLLAIAKARARYYGFGNLRVYLSTDPGSLVENIGKFDFILLTAVYEHLLPHERRTLLPQLWNALESGGVMFLHETPYRFFPVETHTTSGLPFINYLPDRLALRYARRFSKRNLENSSWESLLRRGIRGGSVSEITRFLDPERVCQPVLLQPSRLGINNRIDLWLKLSGRTRYGKVKGVFGRAMKLVRVLTGIEFIPLLTLALQKRGPQRGGRHE